MIQKDSSGFANKPLTDKKATDHRSEESLNNSDQSRCGQKNYINDTELPLYNTEQSVSINVKAGKNSEEPADCNTPLPAHTPNPPGGPGAHRAPRSKPCALNPEP